jgi:hypothetical protein
MSDSYSTDDSRRDEVDLEMDPVLDPAFPRISAADGSLPVPPDEYDQPDEGEQPEPEDVEGEF